jgi:hypothetical protein
VRIEWVHPSWRDLVIGRLRADDRARHEFLARSGTNGTVLALSTAGGGAGERRLPLIGSDEDWDVLTDRLYALIPELEPDELATVLNAVSEAIGGLGRTEAVGEARALARAALARAQQVWDASRAPIPIQALDAWVGLATAIRPRAPLPDVSLTWVELLPTHAPELDDLAALDRFTEWLWLCRLLSDYGPGFPNGLGFGRDQHDLAGGFQSKVDRQRIKYGARSFDATTLDLAVRALDSIAVLDSRLAPYSREIIYMLTIDTSVPERPGTAGPPAPPPTEAFDVRRVLSDL